MRSSACLLAGGGELCGVADTGPAPAPGVYLAEDAVAAFGPQRAPRQGALRGLTGRRGCHGRRPGVQGRLAGLIPLPAVPGVRAGPVRDRPGTRPCLAGRADTTAACEPSTGHAPCPEGHSRAPCMARRPAPGRRGLEGRCRPGTPAGPLPSASPAGRPGQRPGEAVPARRRVTSVLHVIIGEHGRGQPDPDLVAAGRRGSHAVPLLIWYSRYS